MKLKKIYIFSGLGVDERVFKNMDFSGFEVSFISWINPLEKESIESYAKRLSAQITEIKPILVGLSFGGMMAIEVAKLLETEKVILIASAKTKHEIPFYYRLGGILRLQKLIPISFLKNANFITYWFFGTQTKEEKHLLKNILNDTDSLFLRWAINKIVYWKNETCLQNLIHIHGTKDRVLPIRYVSFDIKITDGGHLMTVNKAVEISKLLKENL